MKVTTQAIRYGAVGAASFCADFVITWFCLQYMPLLVANTLGFVFANAINFLLAHQWVFGGAWNRQVVFSNYFSALGISTVGLLINNVVVWTLFSWFGCSLLFAKAAAAAIVMLWNYLTRVLWLYRSQPGDCGGNVGH